mmetsp:Transcript_4732/g.10107  ORF Transcript_4732/g.10107 Transcript_4732/m.10107 type:complete len:190 (+) Transcript_4732:407-976(+)
MQDRGGTGLFNSEIFMDSHSRGASDVARRGKKRESKATKKTRCGDGLASAPCLVANATHHLQDLPEQELTQRMVELLANHHARATSDAKLAEQLSSTSWLPADCHPSSGSVGKEAPRKEPDPASSSRSVPARPLSTSSCELESSTIAAERPKLSAQQLSDQFAGPASQTSVTRYEQRLLHRSIKKRSRV